MSRLGITTESDFSDCTFVKKKRQGTVSLTSVAPTSSEDTFTPFLLCGNSVLHSHYASSQWYVPLALQVVHGKPSGTDGDRQHWSS